MTLAEQHLATARDTIAGYSSPVHSAIASHFGCTAPTQYLTTPTPVPAVEDNGKPAGGSLTDRISDLFEIGE
jgi:hypothetical protein